MSYDLYLLSGVGDGNLEEHLERLLEREEPDAPDGARAEAIAAALPDPLRVGAEILEDEVYLLERHASISCTPEIAEFGLSYARTLSDHEFKALVVGIVHSARAAGYPYVFDPQVDGLLDPDATDQIAEAADRYREGAQFVAGLRAKSTRPWWKFWG